MASRGPVRTASNHAAVLIRTKALPDCNHRRGRTLPESSPRDPERKREGKTSSLSLGTVGQSCPERDAWRSCERRTLPARSSRPSRSGRVKSCFTPPNCFLFLATLLKREGKAAATRSCKPRRQAYLTMPFFAVDRAGQDMHNPGSLVAESWPWLKSAGRICYAAMDCDQSKFSRRRLPR
jgi:hypothetical protein